MNSLPQLTLIHVTFGINTVCSSMCSINVSRVNVSEGEDYRKWRKQCKKKIIKKKFRDVKWFGCRGQWHATQIKLYSIAY